MGARPFFFAPDWRYSPIGQREGERMRTVPRLSVLAALALLAGCGRDEGSGGLSAEEERQLDNAAQMLDDNMIDVSPDSLVANAAELEALDAEANLADNAAGNEIAE